MATIVYVDAQLGGFLIECGYNNRPTVPFPNVSAPPGWPLGGAFLLVKAHGREPSSSAGGWVLDQFVLE
jgi:hypothetical protein